MAASIPATVELLRRRSTDIDNSQHQATSVWQPSSEEISSRLPQLLQTTLETEELIRLFAREINAQVPHDYVAYDNRPEGLHIPSPESAPHHCIQHIYIDEHPLGELTFLRHHKFSLKEVRRLNQLTEYLRYPLRNALMYHRAVKAALIDPLTGAQNRAAMDRALARECALAQRHNLPLSLITIDLDHFKSVNDRYGHSIGDCALKTAAACIVNCVRTDDVVFRYGGEEFTVLLANTPLHGASLLAERIRSKVESTECNMDDLSLRLTVSLGVADFISGDTPDILFTKADKALYQAKQGGRNQVCAYELAQTEDDAGQS